MKMSNLYMRKISLIAGSKLIEQPLTIYFDIPFDDSEKVNDVTIKVYNLKDSTINSIAIKSEFVLTAGYKDDAGVIFQGILKKKESNWEGLDKITSFICVDSGADYLDKVIKKTYGRNTTARTILNDLVGMSGLSIGALELPTNFIYRSGKTVNGKLKKTIIGIAKDCKAKSHVNRNKIFIRDKNKGDNYGIEISKETGLIEEPEEIESEISTDKKAKEKVKRKGYKLKLLINHRVTVDTIIQLKSRKVSGVFRVEKGSHSHDGNAYFTEVEVYPA